MTEARATESSSGTLGTFAGVFTPSILTILGIILFRRLGYVVGGAGLNQTLWIIGLSSAIAIVTSISLSAIATNIRVKGGGDYYLISRTLGVEFGAAIGLILFFGQSISIAFYCMGFAEVTSALLGLSGQVAVQTIAAGAAAFLFVFAWLGADWATRLQYLIMAVLALALVSFFYGGVLRLDGELLAANWGPSGDAGFWFFFALFFPAITGFTQGVSMSGDLKDAGKSLPLGTFLALGVSVLTYFAAAVVFAGAAPRSELVGNYGSMREVAHFDWLIDLGVIAATLSSAMASFLGAPRILQSLASDRVFPFLVPFARGAGPAANPRRGVMLSAVIAIATIGLGSLNLVAPVVSMFFLISYALLNYATFFEARAASPSFRPRFRFFDSRLSLIGAVACLAIMAAIDLMASLVAVAVMVAIYQFVKNTAGPARWADGARSHHFHRVRESLLAMSEDPEHPRDWRPCILAFCDDPARRARLLRFATWVEGRSGLTTAVNVIEGEDEKALQLRDKTDREIRTFIAEHDLEVFPRTIAAPDFRAGVETLIQSFGIGSIRANMVLLSRVDQLHEAEESTEQVRYGRELNEALRLRCNVVVLDADAEEWSTVADLDGGELRIDVWWWGDRTSRLMLLLAYLMTRSERWRDASVRVFVPGSRAASAKTLERVENFLAETRIDAEPEVVEDVDADMVVNRSQAASVVFFPLRYRELSLLKAPNEQLSIASFVKRLPIVALTLAAEDIDLGAGPDEGKIAEAADALDAAKDAEKAAEKAEEEARRLADEVARQRLAQSSEPSRGDAHDITPAKASLQSVESEAVAAAERATEARVQAKLAASAAAELATEATPKNKP